VMPFSDPPAPLVDQEHAPEQRPGKEQIPDRKGHGFHLRSVTSRAGTPSLRRSLCRSVLTKGMPRQRWLIRRWDAVMGAAVLRRNKGTVEAKSARISRRRARGPNAARWRTVATRSLSSSGCATMIRS